MDASGFILYNIQGYYFAVKFSYSKQFKFDFKLNEYTIIEKSEPIDTNLKKRLNLKKKPYITKISNHIVFWERTNFSSLLYYFNKPLLKEKSKVIISEFRLNCRESLISKLSIDKIDINDYLKAFTDYVFFDAFSFWVYNDVTEVFTLSASTLQPQRDYIRKNENMSINEALDTNFYFRHGKPVEKNSISNYGEQGFCSVTRLKVELGANKKIGIISFYSKLKDFEIQESTLKNISSLIRVKYLDSIQILEDGLHMVMSELNSCPINLEYQKYFDILTKKICEELHYEACSAFIVDNSKDCLTLNMMSSYGQNGYVDKTVSYNELDNSNSLTIHAAKQIDTMTVVYDLHEIASNTDYTRNSNYYNEPTDNEGKNWIGIPLSIDEKIFAFLRLKNKYYVNSHKKLVAPGPLDYQSIFTITSLVQNYLKNNEIYNELSDKLRRHDNYASVFRHEIRGPAGSIARWPFDIAEFISHPSFEFNENTREKIICELRDLGGLSKQLVYITKADSSDNFLTDTNKPLESLSLLRDIIIPLEKTKGYYSTKYDSQLIIDHDSMRGAYIYGNIEGYTMVLMALLDNAGKYQKKEEGDIIVKASYQAQNNYLSLQVISDGLPILEEESQSIFSKGERGINAIDYRIDGSGIGLWLASSIMKNYNGELNLIGRESPVIFELKLPLSKL